HSNKGTSGGYNNEKGGGYKSRGNQRDNRYNQVPVDYGPAQPGAAPPASYSGQGQAPQNFLSSRHNSRNGVEQSSPSSSSGEFQYGGSRSLASSPGSGGGPQLGNIPPGSTVIPIIASSGTSVIPHQRAFGGHGLEVIGSSS
ncbi:unnamed protein product, partial [Amoebophrya sp. A25]